MTNRNDFKFIGNDLVLDFLNTVILEDGAPVELLSDANALKLWFEHSGFEIDEGISQIEFQNALRLREAIRLLTQGSGDRAKALAHLNVYITRPTVSAPLVYEYKSYVFEQCPKVNTASEHLKTIAVQAAKLLTETQPKHIRHCANDKCVLMFKDISRSQRRKWCSMDACGNRAKVASHYKRSQTQVTI